MSSEMRELVKRWRERANSLYLERDNESDTKAHGIDDCADDLSALLARTEAGADGDGDVWHVPDSDYQRMYYAEQQLLALREAAATPPVAWRSKDFNPLFNGGFAWAYHSNPGDVGPQHEPLYLHPQDASGDAKFSAAELESLAKCVLASVTPGGFHIPEGWNCLLDKLAAMQAKEAK